MIYHDFPPAHPQETVLSGGGGGWISRRVSLRPLPPCTYMVMAELEDARPRPKFTSFSPVLKRHQQTRVQNVFLWFPCVVPVNNKTSHVISSYYLVCLFPTTNRFLAISRIFLHRNCAAGFASKRAIGLTARHGSCQQMRRDMQLRNNNSKKEKKKENLSHIACVLSSSLAVTYSRPF